MNPTHNQTASPAQAATGPLIMLVLLAATHHPKDTPELLKPFGIGPDEIDKFAAENAGIVDTIRKMTMAGALLDRDTLARLIRVRVGVKLIETEDPRQLAPLVNAAAKLPPWVFGEVEPQAARPSNGIRNNGAHNNGGYLDTEDGLPDITPMGRQETIAEAKRLIDELDQPSEVQVR